MKFLLDTNTCIYMIKCKPTQVLERFQKLEIYDVGVSSISVAELQYGVYTSQRQEQNSTATFQFLVNKRMD